MCPLLPPKIPCFEALTPQECTGLAIMFLGFFHTMLWKNSNILANPIFRDRDFKEVIKIRWGHKGGVPLEGLVSL